MIDAFARPRGGVTWLAAYVCLCCTLPYWRSLSLPAISDDYIQVALGRQYGSFAGFEALAADPLYRCRATSLWLTGMTEALFGFSPIVLNLQSLLLHICNVALIVSFGQFSQIGYKVSILAAFFWGLNERHHEAVMWYASIPEQLVLFFMLIAFAALLKWWEEDQPVYYAASVGAFVLALMSKESGVVFCALFGVLVVYQRRRWRRVARAAIPFLAISVIYFAFNLKSRENHLHWNDGTFEFGWHFLPVIANSAARLFTLWGVAAVGALVYFRKSIDWRGPLLALAWIPVALAPYAFVVYQPRVPSRHVYLASIGIALILAFAVIKLLPMRKTVNAILAAYLIFNTGYIWFYKHGQFVERAEVTERMIVDAKALVGQHGMRPIRVSCFPLAPEIASIALKERLGIEPGLVSIVRALDSSCGKPKVELVQD